MASLGHHCKFQRVSLLVFVTAATLLREANQNFARCLAISCAATLYIFGGSWPLSEFYPAKLCGVVQGMELHNFRRGRPSVWAKELNSSMSPTCVHNMVNFGPLAADNRSGVWGTPSKFQRVSRVLAALLHGTPVVGVSQSLRLSLIHI